MKYKKYLEEWKYMHPFATCYYCGGYATTWDHVVPLSKGGPDLPHNKVRCCDDCNQLKSNENIEKFRRRLSWFWFDSCDGLMFYGETI